MPSSADRNLLFGILALQMDFIGRDQLVAAMNAWVLAKHRPLGEILVEQKALSTAKRQLLEPLVEQHVMDHRDDPQQSLAALSSVSSIRAMLGDIKDADVQDSVSAVTANDHHPATGSPSTLGYSDTTRRYRILRPHARGGLGEVFVAEDAELHREVALKEIQRDKDRQENRARFLLEAEITGGLEHPGIVPVYGLGHYEDGRPYYAMRFIKGDNLAEAIKRFHAPTCGLSSQHFDSLEFRRLLQRFIDVCEAVAYAHSRGVLHRDLKPGNIMLGKYGETLVVDWGLAKAAGRSEDTDGLVADPEATLKPASGSDVSPTAYGAAIGTPAYMSPEQAEGRLDQLGPASDVYSLGATLYHLLVGKPRNHDCDAIDAVVRAQIGEFFHPRAHNPNIPQSLEAICLKAMALKPTNRYATAQELAVEIEHWLADEPVGAWREPIGVQARRWVRKHSRLVVGLVAASTMGAIGLGALAWQREHARAAIAAEQTETARERDRANGEREAAQAIQYFLQEKLLLQADAEIQADSLLAAGHPLSMVDRDPRLSTLLDRAAAEVKPESIETNFPGQPRVQISLLGMIGRAYIGTAHYTKAVSHLKRAEEHCVRHFGDDHPITVDTLSRLGRALMCDGRISEAAGLFQRVADYRGGLIGPVAPGSLSAQIDLAGCLQMLGKPEAKALLESLLPAVEIEFGRSDKRYLAVLRSLGCCYLYGGKPSAGVRLLEEASDGIAKTFGAKHPKRLITNSDLAFGYLQLGRHADAKQLLVEIRDEYLSKLGPDHSETLAVLKTIGDVCLSLGQLDEAVVMLERSRDGLTKLYGPDHPRTVTTLALLGGCYSKLGRHDEAIRLLEQVRDIVVLKYGAASSYTWTYTNSLATAYSLGGQNAKAIAEYDQIVKASEEKRGADHPSTITYLKNMAATHTLLGRYSDALPLLEKAAKGVERQEFRVAIASETIDDLVMCYERLGKFEQAGNWRRKWLAIVKDRHGAESPQYVNAAAVLGFNLIQQAKWAEAETILRIVVAFREKAEPNEWATGNNCSMLGEALSHQSKFAESEPLLVQGYEVLKQKREFIPAAVRTQRLLEALNRIVRLYTAWDKPVAAAKWRAELEEVEKANLTKPAEKADEKKP